MDDGVASEKIGYPGRNRCAERRVNTVAIADTDILLEHRCPALVFDLCLC